jgi:hypothetical protein
MDGRRRLAGNSRFQRTEEMWTNGESNTVSRVTRALICAVTFSMRRPVVRLGPFGNAHG